MSQSRKLDRASVAAIWNSTDPIQSLARQFGVHRRVIQRIKRRETYADWLPGPTSGYYLGDALTFMRSLPAGYCPTIFTSPPYNLRTRKRTNSGKDGKWASTFMAGDSDGYDGFTDDLPPAEYEIWQRHFLTECARVVGPAGVVVYNHKPRAQNGIMDLRYEIIRDIPGLPLRAMVVWDKLNTHQLGGETMLRPPDTYELLYVLAADGWQIPRLSKPLVRKWRAVWQIPRDQKNPHPAPFPLELARRAIAFGEGRVLDPFAGSGTTLLAAQEAGRDYLGVDLSEKYRGYYLERLADRAPRSACFCWGS